MVATLGALQEGLDLRAEPAGDLASREGSARGSSFTRPHPRRRQLARAGAPCALKVLKGAAGYDDQSAGPSTRSYLAAQQPSGQYPAEQPELWAYTAPAGRAEVLPGVADLTSHPELQALPGTPQVAPRTARRPSRRTFVWRRVFVLCLVGVVGALAWSLLAAALSAKPAPAGTLGAQHVCGPSPVASGAPCGATYTVRPGDTLWGIAVRYTAGSDPRALVSQLESETGGGVLQPGEVLQVP